MTQDPAAAQRAAARVAGAADLLDVRMLDCQCTLTTTAAPEQMSVAFAVEHEVERESSDDALVVQIRVSVTISDAAPSASPDGDSRHEHEQVALMQATWALLYELVDLEHDEASADDFTAFAQTSATMTLFPYAREFFTSTTNRLGLPKLVLPTFRLPSPWHPDDSAPLEIDGAAE